MIDSNGGRDRTRTCDLLRVKDSHPLQGVYHFSPTPNDYNNLGSLLFAQKVTQAAPTGAVQTQFWHRTKAGASPCSSDSLRREWARGTAASRVPYGISDASPASVYIAVPRNARLRRVCPKWVELHHADQQADEVTTHEGLPLTTVGRTVQDVLASTGQVGIARPSDRGRLP